MMDRAFLLSFDMLFWAGHDCGRKPAGVPKVTGDELTSKLQLCFSGTRRFFLVQTDIFSFDPAFGTGQGTEIA